MTETVPEPTLASNNGSPDLADSTLYQSLFDLNPQPMWVYDSETWRFLTVNEAAIRTYGYSREEFLEMSIKAIRPAEDLAKFVAYHANRKQSDDSLMGEWRHRSKSGRIFEVEISTRRLAFQGRPAELVIARDIQQRRLTQRLLSVRYATTRIIAESVSDATADVLHLLGQSLGSEIAEFWIAGSAKGGFQLQSRWQSEAAPQGAEARAPITDVASAPAVPCDEPTWIRNLARHPFCEARHEGLTKQGIRCGVMFPVRSGLGRPGIVLLLHRGAEAPAKAVLELLVDIGAQLGQHLDRLRTTAELVKAEEAFRSLFDDGPIPYHEIDGTGILTRVNRAECELLGMQAHELTGRPVWDLVSPEEREISRRSVARKLLEGRTPPPFERRYQASNGDEYVFEIHERVLLDAAGVVCGIRTAMLDITARRSVEAALKKSEERFRIAVENSADLVFEMDHTTGAIQTFTRPGWDHDLAQYAPNSLAELSESIHAEDRARVLSNLEAHQKQGEPYSIEYRMKFPTGEIRHVSVHAGPVRDSSGLPQKWIGVVKDVTSIKRAERAVAEQAAIVESLDVALVSLDLEGRILTWNPGAQGMYGYTAEEVVGQNIMRIVPAEVAAQESRLLEASRLGERIEHLEAVRVTRSGETVHVALTISPMRNESGILIGAARVATNITERKRLQQQLAQAQKLESIGQLAAGVAHEINTPIQYVGDNARFLEESFHDLLRCIQPGAAVPADVDVEYLQSEIPLAIRQLCEGIERVARIVRAMKEFSHPGSARKAPADLNRAIESTLLVCRKEWKYEAELTTDFDPDLPAIPCMLGEFNQVILNLVVNAAHAIGDVVKGTGSKGAIHVSTRQIDGCAEIQVRDTGGGIPEAIQSKVFDPFFTTKPAGQGTGQGLAIAHAVIVQKHRGSIRFETQAGQGTTFIIRLPLESDEK